MIINKKEGNLMIVLASPMNGLVVAVGWPLTNPRPLFNYERDVGAACTRLKKHEVGTSSYVREWVGS
jgi:hypothetical protein